MYKKWSKLQYQEVQYVNAKGCNFLQGKIV